MALLKLILLVAVLSPLVAGGGGNFFEGFQWDFSSLSRRMQMLSLDFDGNRDKNITLSELTAALNRLYDFNNDGCVTEEEWAKRWKALMFTEDFAKFFFGKFSAQFSPSGSGCKGLDTRNLKLNSSPLANTIVVQNSSAATFSTVEVFLDNVVQSLSDLCEAEHLRYFTNKDCSSLPSLCLMSSTLIFNFSVWSSPPFRFPTSNNYHGSSPPLQPFMYVIPPFACRRPCLNYTFVTSAGRDPPFGLSRLMNFTMFAYKLRSYAEAFDVDRDGQITAQEAQKEWMMNYDLNNDGCVNKTEFRIRMILGNCGGFGFSEEFTSMRFDALKVQDPTGKCDGINTARSASMSVNDFKTANIESLVSFCEGNRDLYDTNYDCRTLLASCRDYSLRELDVCKDYRQRKENWWWFF